MVRMGAPSNRREEMEGVPQGGNGVVPVKARKYRPLESPLDLIIVCVV